jgi:hypothetical protein
MNEQVSAKQKHDKRTPDVFLAGSPKCGTTTVRQWLIEHPDVCLSRVKKINYFRESNLSKNKNFYLQHFVDDKENSLIVDGSAKYLHTRDTMPNILDLNPNAYFIVMFRHPVELFCSHYQQLKWGMKESAETPEQAWRNTMKTPRTMSASEMSDEELVRCYDHFCSLGSQLEYLYQHVPRERVFIVFLEDLASHPETVYGHLVKFLGIQDDGRAAFGVTNSRKARKYPRLSRLVLSVLKVVSRVKKRLGINNNWGLLSPLQTIVQSKEKVSKQTITPEFRKELIDFFSEDISKLEHLTGRNLSHWYE